jgi:hypothetical protein
MKRTLLILPMLTAILSLSLPLAAQEAPQTQPDAKPCLKLKKVQTDANAVPQSGTIQMTLHLEAVNCAIAYQRSTNPFTVQGLAMDNQSPFRVTSGATWYSKIEPLKGDSARETARNLEYRLQVNALADAPVGKQDFVATLSYQTVDGEGQLSMQEQSISIPIKVVPAGTHVKQRIEHDSKEVTKTVVLIALSPVLIPLMLIGGVVYYFQHGQWPNC